MGERSSSLPPCLDEAVPSTIPAPATSASREQAVFVVERIQRTHVVVLGLRGTAEDAFALAATSPESAGEVRVTEVQVPSRCAGLDELPSVRVWKHVGKGVWTASDVRGSGSRS